VAPPLLALLTATGSGTPRAPRSPPRARRHPSARSAGLPRAEIGRLAGRFCQSPARRGNLIADKAASPILATWPTTRACVRLWCRPRRKRSRPRHAAFRGDAGAHDPGQLRASATPKQVSFLSQLGGSRGAPKARITDAKSDRHGPRRRSKGGHALVTSPRAWPARVAVSRAKCFIRAICGSLPPKLGRLRPRFALRSPNVKTERCRSV
jgi:hypothetical protein